jgi:cytochrome P450
VIDEALRLHPPVPIAVRWVAKDTELGGMSLPQGTYIALCAHLAQRDPARFPDPLHFHPERFLGARPDPFVYFPFGGGKRTCLGQPFALFEMKVVLASILQRAELVLLSPASFRAHRKGVVQQPASGVPIRVVKRLD